MENTFLKKSEKIESELDELKMKAFILLKEELKTKPFIFVSDQKMKGNEYPYDKIIRSSIYDEKTDIIFVSDKIISTNEENFKYEIPEVWLSDGKFFFNVFSEEDFLGGFEIADDTFFEIADLIVSKLKVK